MFQGPINPHLFVYGSLMSTAGHPMGHRLRREAEPIGSASLPGRLYRVSWYPGLVEAKQPGDRVFGEVFRLHTPSRSLCWLDAYEGLPAKDAGRSEYERAERLARLDDGTEVTAWVYLYRGEVGRLEAVASGRWLPPAS
jgi:gamma-glutamylcyclotransferase (GGCT)/AIG2-like uncharacterized protein YtfP